MEHIFLSSCCARPEAEWDTSPQEKICCDFGPGGPGKYIYPTTYNSTVNKLNLGPFDMYLESLSF